MTKKIDSRRKGAVGERELAQALQVMGWEDSHRTAQRTGVHGDADLTDAIPGVHIECKRVERLNIHEAMEQAVSDAIEGDVPAVFHRRNRKPWLVTVRLVDLVKFGKRIEQ